MNVSAPPDNVSDTSIDMGLVLAAVIKRVIRIIVLTLVLCGLAYAVLQFMPRIYQSSAGLLLEPRSNVFTRATSDANQVGALIDAATVASEIELIKSRSTILAAIEESGLRDEPEFARTSSGPLARIGLGGTRDASEQELIDAVTEALVVTQERNSRLISVAFRSRDPELAARVANAVAMAHIGVRAGQQVSDTADATAWLELEINELRTRVSSAERAVADFRVENDLFQGANNTSLVDQQLSDLAAQITSATERRNAAESRAQLIRNLIQTGQSVNGVSDVQASPIVQQLSQELTRLQGERAQRSATLLDNHPTIRALDAQIGAVNQQITAEGRRVADALEAQAQIESNLEQSLEEELTRRKITAGAASVEGVELASLEREATALRELLNAYLIRYSEAAARSDTGAALPDIRLVSQAAPSSSPVSPRTALTLIAVFIGALVLQLGAVIFSELLSGRALVTRRSVTDPVIDGSDTETQKPETLSDEPDVFATAMTDDPGVVHIVGEEEQPAATPTTWPRQTPMDVEIEALAIAAISGKSRIIVVASCDTEEDSTAFGERLSAKIVSTEQSVAEIDAASGQQGLELGLTDLCAGEADFGDVVHRGADQRFAFVPWGQNAALVRHPERAATLVGALSDIYEAVIIVTGKVGVTSSLPLFSGLDAQCVLLSRDVSRAERIRDEVAALGFEDVHAVSSAGLHSEVA